MSEVIIIDPPASSLTDGIVEKAKRLSELKRLVEEKEGEISVLKKEQNSLELSIPEMMDDAGITKLSVTGVGLVYTEARPTVSISAVDKPQFFAYLRETGHADIIKEDVHWRTMNSWAKDVMETGQVLPEYLKVFSQIKARIRKNG